eukprot:8038332-Alexandrium_andersonii.AAC.1
MHNLADTRTMHIHFVTTPLVCVCMLFTLLRDNGVARHWRPQTVRSRATNSGDCGQLAIKEP